MRIDWDAHRLAAIEPSSSELVAAAPALAAAYNDPAIAPLLGHDEPFSAADVIAHVTELRAEGGRPFLLYEANTLAGDADLRGVVDRGAELAILILRPGRGLGTRFAIMMHAFAFSVLGLERVTVAIVPENQASLRLFARLGYRVDTSPSARALVDDEREVALSVARADFERAHAAELAEVRVSPIAT
jgi:RimJ/RimL family protein N-acetyltransferase